MIRTLAGEWEAAGLCPGDMVLVHSTLRRLTLRLRRLGLKAGAAPVLQSLREAVGTKGTLLFPLFNFDFAGGAQFDIRATPSQMGALTEAARNDPMAVRTGHPIYSFAVLGAYASEFTGLVNYSGYGADSPFGILHRSGGRIAVLDLPDQTSMTFYHYVEEALSVPYRYHKIFRGLYRDAAGRASEREFGLFVRNLDRGVVTDVGGMERRLWDHGLYRGNPPGQGSGMRSARAADIFDATAAVIAAGEAEGHLYRIEHTAA